MEYVLGPRFQGKWENTRIGAPYTRPLSHGGKRRHGDSHNGCLDPAAPHVAKDPASCPWPRHRDPLGVRRRICPRAARPICLLVRGDPFFSPRYASSPRGRTRRAKRERVKAFLSRPGHAARRAWAGVFLRSKRARQTGVCRAQCGRRKTGGRRTMRTKKSYEADLRRTRSLGSTA